MPTGSFDGAAVLIGRTFPQHDRTAAHYGYEWDDDVLLAAAIGPYPVATPLNVFLAGLYASFTSLATLNPSVRLFTADAIISGGILRVNAVIWGTRTGSLTANAYLTGGGVAAITADAWILPGAKTLTADALLVENVC